MRPFCVPHNIKNLLVKNNHKEETKMEIKTSDLYCASYIFSQGGELKEVQLSRISGRRRAEFIFTGKNVQQLEKTFLSGKAIVDLKTFKASLNHIKDVMFQTIRSLASDRGPS